MAGMLLNLALLGGIGWMLFARLAKNLHGHYLTALVWTAITGFQTLSLLEHPGVPNMIGHVVVLFAGWIMVSSWQQLGERKRGELYRQKKRHLLYRLLMQTLWGPLALWGLTGLVALRSANF